MRSRSLCLDSGTMIDDADHGPAALKPHIDLDRRRAVPLGIVEEVAHHALQQASIAA